MFFFKKKKTEMETQQEDLLSDIHIARKDNDIFFMEKVAYAYAIGEGTEKNLSEAEKWYAMALEEELALRVKQSGGVDFVAYPFADAVTRYCTGEIFPVDLNKAMQVAKYMLKRNLVAAGQFVQYVRALQKKESASLPVTETEEDFRYQLAVFVEERERLQDELDRQKEFMRQQTEVLGQQMKEYGANDLESRIDWILNQTGWPAAGMTILPQKDMDFLAAIEIERQGKDYKKAIRSFKKLSGAEAKRRLGNLYRKAMSSYEGDEEWNIGTELLQQAVSAGSALAVYDLGQSNLDVSAIAGIAKGGDLEAIEALGCMLQRGLGGSAHPLMARLVFEEGIRLLSEKGEPAEGWQQYALSRFYANEGEEEKALYWLAIASQKSKYPPAMYRTCIEPKLDARLSPSYVEETLNEAWKSGFEKAGLDSINRLNEWHNSEVTLAEGMVDCMGTQNDARQRMTDKVEAGMKLAGLARKSKLILDPELIRKYPQTAALCDEELGKLMAQETRDVRVQKRQQEREQAMQSNTETHGSVNDLPGMLFDEWGRTWEADVFSGQYVLSADYSANSMDNAMAAIHPLSNFGDTVVIRDDDISGRCADAGGHHFTW